MNASDMDDGKDGRPAAAGAAPLWRGALFGLLCSATILVLLARSGLLRMDPLAEAWHQRRGMLWSMLLLQAGMATINVIRYRAILLACGVRARMRDAAAATLVSTGISLWLPASAAVSELLRAGLMCGAEVNERAGLPARVALASLLDRTLGLIVVFLFGAAAALGLLWHPLPGVAHTAALRLTVALGLLGAALLAAALLALRRWALRSDGGRGPGLPLPGWTPQRLRRVGARLWQAVSALRRQRLRLASLAAPVLLAWLAFTLLAWIYLLAIRAVGGEAALASVAVALPYFTLAGLLPISVGGLGGQQLVTVATLSLLGSEPAAVAAAGVLNAAVVLGLHTLLAGIFAGISHGQLRVLWRRSAGRSVAARATKSETKCGE